MPVSLLFYSNFCNNCKQIVGEINNSPIRSSVKYVCIDSQSIRAKLPKYISSVPSLVVGETNQVFVGNQISGWLKMLPITQRNATVQSRTQVASAQHVPKKKTQQTTQEPGEPGAWHCNEMNSFSDGYSFLGVDTSAEGNGGMSMVHNFETLSGDGGGSGTGSMPGGAPCRGSMPVQYNNPVSDPMNGGSYGSIQTSEKEDALNKSFEELMSRRELDVPNMPARV